MPAQRGKSSLNNLISKHAGDETVYSGDYLQLPGGIHGGIAQLVEAKIGIYKSGPNQGQEFLYLAGIVVSPQTATQIIKILEGNKVKIVSAKEIEIQGARTSLTMPLCETKKQSGDTTTADENVERALNEVRKLGGDTSSLSSQAELEELLDDLKNASPYFRFSTSQTDPTIAYPNSRTWENWHGTKGLEDYTAEAVDGVTDNTAASKAKQPAKSKSAKQTGDDLDSLASKADDGDEEAQTKLGDLAEKAGIGDKAIIGARNWAELVSLIRAKLVSLIQQAELTTEQAVEPEQPEEDEGEPEKPDEPEEPEEEEPQKGQVYTYRPIDPKTKKPAKKPVDVEVIAVNSKAGTVDLKLLDNPKVKYTKIPWTDLESE